jgi:hypothetical protein
MPEAKFISEPELIERWRLVAITGNMKGAKRWLRGMREGRKLNPKRPSHKMTLYLLDEVERLEQQDGRRSTQEVPTPPPRSRGRPPKEKR